MTTVPPVGPASVKRPDGARWTPIPTEWHGYQFRSRIEARWAVFFDTLEIPYRYEVEGFDLDGVRYLPDFWLPDQDCWFEVKGEVPLPKEQDKARRLAVACGLDCFIAWGDCVPSIGGHDGIEVWLAEGIRNAPMLWAELARGQYEPRLAGAVSLGPDLRYVKFAAHTEALSRAYRHARQQRFGT